MQRCRLWVAEAVPHRPAHDGAAAAAHGVGLRAAASTLHRGAPAAANDTHVEKTHCMSRKCAKAQMAALKLLQLCRTLPQARAGEQGAVHLPGQRAKGWRQAATNATTVVARAAMVQPAAAAVGMVGMLLQLLQLCTKSMVHLMLLLLLLRGHLLLLLLLGGQSSLLLLVLLPGQQVCCCISCGLQAQQEVVSSTKRQGAFNTLRACTHTSHTGGCHAAVVHEVRCVHLLGQRLLPLAWRPLMLCSRRSRRLLRSRSTVVHVIPAAGTTALPPEARRPPSACADAAAVMAMPGCVFVHALSLLTSAASISQTQVPASHGALASLPGQCCNRPHPPGQQVLRQAHRLQFAPYVAPSVRAAGPPQECWACCWSGRLPLRALRHHCRPCCC